MTIFEILFNDHSECCYEQYLYNTTPHLRFQPSTNLFHLSLVNRQTGLCNARIHFFVEDNKALSSFKAPFGSLEFAPGLDVAEILRLIRELEIRCRSLNVIEIEITSYPFCYNHEHSQLLFNCFIQEGYKVNQLDLNFHIDTKQDFLANLHLSAKRRLKKCLQKGYTFEKLNKQSLKEVYDLYVRIRDFTGIPKNMPFDKLEKYFENFPDQYHVFCVKDGPKIIAASICVNPSSSILYNFLPCDDPAYRNDSPMVLLINGTTDYCCKNNIKIFDLGTASIKGIPQVSLMKFKQNLGAKLSPKPQYIKQLF